MARRRAAVTEAERKRFVRAFKAKMDVPTARRTLDLLAALSDASNLSIGCYCEHEACCHRLCFATSGGPRGEPQVAAAAAAEAPVADGQDFVPHADRRATYIPLVAQHPNRKESP
jgi:hypothetical protein